MGGIRHLNSTRYLDSPGNDEIWVDAGFEAIRRLSVDIIQTQFSLSIDVFANVIEATLGSLKSLRRDKGCDVR